jgi:hypothetical protein
VLLKQLQKPNKKEKQKKRKIIKMRKEIMHRHVMTEEKTELDG